VTLQPLHIETSEEYPKPFRIKFWLGHDEVRGMGFSLEFAVPRWLLIREYFGKRDYSGVGIDIGILKDKNGYGVYATTKSTRKSGLSISAQVETFTAVRNKNADMSMDRYFLRGPGNELSFGAWLFGGSYSTGLHGPSGAMPKYNVVTLSGGPGLDFVGYVDWNTKTYVW